MKTLICIALASLALTLSTQATSQFDFSAEVSGTFGFDEETRDLIRSAPDLVAEAARKVQPIVDDSVFRYMDHVDELAASRIDQLSCSADGLVQKISEEIKKTIDSTRPSPIQPLLEDWEALQTQFKYDSTVQSIAVGYEEFLYRAHRAACKVSMVPETLERVATYRLHAERRWAVWKSLEQNRVCIVLSECYDKYRPLIIALVDAADPKDKRVARTDDLVRGLQRPPKPGYFSFSFKHEPFEAQLARMQLIATSLKAARKDRETSEMTVAAIRSELSALEARRAAAHMSLGKSRGDGGRNQSVFSACNRIVERATTMLTELRIAQAQDPSSQASIADLVQRTEILQRHARTTADEAQQYGF